MAMYRNLQLCRNCWDELHPDRAPIVIPAEFTNESQCIRCELLTSSGIFVRCEVII